MPPGHRKSASRDVSATIDREPSKSHSRKPSISKVQSRGVLTRATRRTRVSSEPDVSDAESSSSSKVVEAVVEKTERPNHETMIDDSDFYPNESKGWKGFANCVSIGVIVNLVCLWAIPASARHEIAAVSRRPTRSDDPELNAIVPALKLLSMAAMWFLGFDDSEALNVSIATWCVHYIFLYAFKDVSLETCLILFGVSVSSTATPFIILRARHPWHPRRRAPRKRFPGATKKVAQDMGLWIASALFASAVYSVSLLFFYRTGYLTAQMTTFFEDITFVHAHSKRFQLIVPLLMVPVGFAVKTFLFSPVYDQGLEVSAEEKAKEAEFDPARASIWQTWLHTIGPLNPSTSAGKRILRLLSRAAYLIVMQVVYTTVETGYAIRGAQPLGALIWGLMWGAATAAIAAGYAAFITV